MVFDADKPPVGGACSGKPVALFYPDPRTRVITSDMRKALGYCKGCSVLDHCAEYGIRHEMHGIWGGLTEKQRAVIRLDRDIKVSVPGYADPGIHRNSK